MAEYAGRRRGWQIFPVVIDTGPCDADPLADPANYAKISAVYKDGLPVKRIITLEPRQ